MDDVTPHRATIVAGNFEHRTVADEAFARLERIGVASEHLFHFALNAPGQHDRTPIGGDQDADPGAEKSHLTAGVGAAVGAAAGVGVALIAAPVVGAAIALGAIGAGAYAGSLQGAVAGMETDPSKQVGDLAIRPAGAMLAVRIDSPAQEQDVIGALYEAGARVVERTQGIWRDGEWADFDPVSTPQIVAPLQRAQGA